MLAGAGVCVLMPAPGGADPVPEQVEMVSFPASGEDGPTLEGELCLPRRPSAEARNAVANVCPTNTNNITPGGCGNVM